MEGPFFNDSLDEPKNELYVKEKMYLFMKMVENAKL